MMATKTAPLGICDLCGGEIPSELGPYTSKGKPRLYCSNDCRNTANSRAGTEERTRKVRQRIKAGQWQNPADLHKPDPANVAAGVSRARKAEVEAGTWRNPALENDARQKLSRPREHEGALHRAIEKLGRSLKMNQLTPDEQQAYRVYRRKQRAELWKRKSETEREALRSKWREQKRKK